MDTTNWHSLSVPDTLKKLSARMDGLTSEEVETRAAQFGRNEIVHRKPNSPLRLFFKQFGNFFILMLLFAAALAYGVSFLPGESNRQLTAFFILGIIVLSVCLSFFEEYRAQKELEALDRLLVFKARVIRNGIQREVNAVEIVPGDILVLAHGEKVSADARVLEAHGLRADESALTGESLGVEKSPEPVSPEAALAEYNSMIFASTFITYGTGLAIVVRTGMATEVGKIATELGQISERATPFQREVQKMARQMTIIVGGLALLVAAILYFILQEAPIDIALNTLSLAVATIPESLPIVLTFALALGAHDMSVRRAVVRRLSVVESLGSVDTICTDKTGTLTQNRLTVQRLFADGQIQETPQDMPASAASQELLRAGLLCNDAALESDGANKKISGDPVDTAMLVAAQMAGLDIEQVRGAWPRVNEIPFSSERKMMTTIHRHGEQMVGYTKGAAEVVLARCAQCFHQEKTIGLEEAACQAVQRVVEQLERDAWYVLALATKPNATVENAEEGLTFIGLQAMKDPVRPEAAAAIARAQEAGIRVIMITGDNLLTAQAVGKQLGIGERTAEASELDNLLPPALQERMKAVDIVARATPQTKQHVLQALQTAGHFVAMTGDGVNDATALKQSDVGVAMGLRGTDIAKESAAMVLLDDNFETILVAVEEGRRIFDNIRKFTNYLLSTSLGEVIVVLALSMTGFFPLSAKMLLWVNVVTDLIPASALAADPAVPHIMKRRPRRHDEPILNKAIYATILGSIFRTLIAYGLVFWVGLLLGGVTYARTMLFTSIVLHAFTRVMVVRQLDNLPLWSNRALLWSYAAAVGLQLLALYTPLRDLFGIVPLDWRAWAVMIPVVVASSLAGVYMTRWIVKILPLWEK
jgi:P-type Ca2+ transporter type 2C